MAKKTRIKKAAPIKPAKTVEVNYRRTLNKFAKVLIKSVNENVLIFLKSQEASYVIDGIDDQLENIFNELNSKFLGVAVAGFAETTATQTVNKINQVNKAKFARSIGRATGIDLGSVISQENLDDFISLNIKKNISLIKSLPEEYIKQVEIVVNNGVASGKTYATIEQEIRSRIGVNHKLFSRIKTIATNETQTIHAQLMLRRSENLGIKEGIYRTSEDEKVRDCHKELNNVRYDLSKGAWSKTCKKFIQPGITDINCRCSYSPIIEII